MHPHPDSREPLLTYAFSLSLQSVVRKQTGIPFEGGTYESLFYVLDCQVTYEDEATRKRLQRGDFAMVNLEAFGFT